MGIDRRHWVNEKGGSARFGSVRCCWINTNTLIMTLVRLTGFTVYYMPHFAGDDAHDN